MTKKLVVFLALVLAVALLGGCSLVEIDTTKITVASVNGVAISKAEFDEQLNAYLSGYGYTVDSAEIADQLAELRTNFLESLIENEVIKQKAVELGFGEVTQEEKDAAIAEAQEWWDTQKASLVESYKSDETVEDPEAKAEETLTNYMTYYGYDSIDAMAQAQIDAIPTNKLYESVTGDVEVTDEEAKEAFDAQVVSDKEKYATDLATFVSDYNGGMSIYTIPEGLFYVKHILISLTDEQKTELQSLRTAGDDAVADEYRTNALKDIQPKTDEVLAKVEAGEDFDALIEQYGEDPGMQSDTYKEKGYLTYVGNPSYMAEFTAACDLLTADGMTSGLVATDYGYHIIRRVSTLAAGEVEYTDEIKELLRAKLYTSKQEEAYTAALEEWKAAMDVKTFEDKLA